MLKTTLIIALVAHVLCGVSDCLPSYGRKGRIAGAVMFLGLVMVI